LVNQDEIPEIMEQTCTPWMAWKEEHEPWQFDSGLKLRSDYSQFKKRGADN
jgi:hypothetical protein